MSFSFQFARSQWPSINRGLMVKCYGGDISRKQKEGKKRMKSIGRVNIPQEAFIQVLKTN